MIRESSYLQTLYLFVAWHGAHNNGENFSAMYFQFHVCFQQEIGGLKVMFHIVLLEGLSILVASRFAYS